LADYRAHLAVLGLHPRFFNAWRRTEPVIRLLKQGEQVKDWLLEGPARRFARIPSLGIQRRDRGPPISERAIIGLAVILTESQNSKIV
jgi:hypothetical protein